MKQFVIIDKSGRLSAQEVEYVAQAVQIQMAVHFAPAHGLMPATVKAYSDLKLIPKAEGRYDLCIVTIVDKGDEPDALGEHSEDQDGTVWAHVAVGPVLDAGGGVLDGGAAGCSVASVVSHEITETMKNPGVNQYVYGPQIEQGSQYAEEVADPCESTLYPVTLPDGTIVHVSGFVTPEWFDEETPAGTPTSYPAGATPGPFKLAQGGYCMCRSAPGTDAEVFGEHAPPEWKMEMKRKNKQSRLNRHHHRKTV